jgi:aminomethyltransferase
VLRTPLHAEHQKLGASFTDFGGWDMPVRYGSDLDEHHAVRNSAGLFDISHMSEFAIVGAGAAEFLDHALVSQVSKLAIGRAKYTMLCNETGGVIDDLIVYRLADQEFLIIANASGRQAVWTALQERSGGFDLDKLEDQSDELALIAIQGPKATEILQRSCSTDLAPLKYYSIADGTVAGVAARLARTGYTGEDGFEVLVAAGDAATVWQALLADGGDELTACGLACRDTLRLEAGMPLYGHELGLDRNPFQAGLGRIVNLGRHFIGDSALEAAQDAKPRLYGLRGEGRRAARADYEVFLPGGESAIGSITSGALSPTLGYAIAMAYLSGNLSTGDMVEADVRGTRIEFEVVDLPFYRRAK